ncbi:MAG: HNH endonuclease, partial [Candidatus Eremiobacteraeota bacterium]|nr:HNH endonuclease [Candidatus Eremiobacteraeota bacterium]
MITDEKQRQFWTVENLSQLSHERLEQVTRRLSNTLALTRILLGRCLLAIERSNFCADTGCHSAIHFARLIKVDKREAQDAMRIAGHLEELPLFARACEENKICWSNLRVVSRIVTPETEEAWLDLAVRLKPHRLARLVTGASRGDTPAEAALNLVEEVELRIRVSPEVSELWSRAVAVISRDNGGVVNPAEAFELILADFLGGQVEQLKVEAAQDLAAPPEALAVQAHVCPGDSKLQLAGRLRFNPATRQATAAQRRAVLRRDGYRCSCPGCPNRLWLDVHHVVFYCRGGPTVPENLIVVCSRCHKNIHQGILRVSGVAPHGLVWRDRRGREL